jgi:hypothetical protein
MGPRRSRPSLLYPIPPPPCHYRPYLVLIRDMFRMEQKIVHNLMMANALKVTLEVMVYIHTVP